jgi:hypothetical protein
MTAQHDGVPTLRLTMYRHGARVTELLCESESEAADLVVPWEDVDGVVWELDDLGTRHEPDDVLAPEPEDVMADDFDEPQR